MPPKDKYTTYSPYGRGYRKGIHKVPKWTRVCSRVSGHVAFVDICPHSAHSGPIRRVSEITFSSDCFTVQYLERNICEVPALVSSHLIRILRLLVTATPAVSCPA